MREEGGGRKGGGGREGAEGHVCQTPLISWVCLCNLAIHLSQVIRNCTLQTVQYTLHYILHCTLPTTLHTALHTAHCNYVLVHMDLHFTQHN